MLCTKLGQQEGCLSCSLCNCLKTVQDQTPKMVRRPLNLGA